MTSNKRLIKELQRLQIQQNSKQLLDNDYLVYFDDNNINKVYTIIKAPYDSVYRHKFIRLNFNIPENYPHSPPKVTFVNYDGVRIHPNFYEDGKCCSTILNTWPSENEKWTSSMGIETILLTFLSFLDNDPYKYEPGDRGDKSYTNYVLYQSWKTCLIQYLSQSKEMFSEYIEAYLLQNIDKIFDDLKTLEYKFPLNFYETRCFEIGLFKINYADIINSMKNIYRYITFKNQIPKNNIENYKIEDIENYNKFGNFNCDICFDTKSDKQIILSCNHHFHIKCLSKHVKENGEICSLCRKQLIDNDKKDLYFTINPQTNRRIKIGGKIYNQLVKIGIISL